MEHLEENEVAAYLDYAVAVSERDQVEAHLLDCAACRERLAAQVRAQGIEEAAERKVTVAELSRARLRPALLIAAAVAALLIGIGIWRAADVASDGSPTTAEAESTQSPPTTTAERPPAAAREQPVDRVAERPPPEARQAPEPALDPELLALRGATRRSAGKTFHLRDGAWVDQDYRPDAGPAPIELTRGAAAFETALAQHPELASYAGVGPVVVVLVDTSAYRIVPAPDRAP